MEVHHIHMVSDSTGETVSSIVRSVMSQFEDVGYEEHHWTLVRTKGQMGRALEAISDNPGIILYTIIDDELQEILRKEAKRIGVPCVPVLEDATREISQFVGKEAKAKVGRQHVLDEEYFDKVEAMNFTLAHDDGQNIDDIDEADLILVGVSRTSKTPTCVYLSFKGIKAANVPFVKEIPLPDKLFEIKDVFILGLVISPERLIQIRKSRLVSLNENRETSYTDIEKIKEEVLEAKRLYLKHDWPLLDVTRKSVEETSAMILQQYEKWKSIRKEN